MKGAAPPLRFLVLVIAGWTGFRVALLLPDWLAAGVTPSPPAPVSAGADPVPRQHPTPDSGPAAAAAATPAARKPAPRLRFARWIPAPGHPGINARWTTPSSLPTGPSATPSSPVAAAQSIVAPVALEPARPAPQRWSASAWLLVREELGNPVLAPGGTLGGSQAGGRLLYRLNDDAARPLALSARLYTPLRRTSGAEAAFGLDWRPVARVPVNVLIERREALGDEGRSAFALTLYGGASANLPARLRLDTYVQAGVAGVRSRDLFIDGAARIVRPIGPVEIGAGAWGAAQPGAARLDAGPQISWRLPVDKANIRLSADWRFRIAGDAEPGSGPALTLGADF